MLNRDLLTLDHIMMNTDEGQKRTINCTSLDYQQSVIFVFIIPTTLWIWVWMFLSKIPKFFAFESTDKFFFCSVNKANEMRISNVDGKYFL